MLMISYCKQSYLRPNYSERVIKDNSEKVVNFVTLNTKMPYCVSVVSENDKKCSNEGPQQRDHTFVRAFVCVEILQFAISGLAPLTFNV